MTCFGWLSQGPPSVALTHLLRHHGKELCQQHLSYFHALIVLARLPHAKELHCFYPPTKYPPQHRPDIHQLDHHRLSVIPCTTHISHRLRHHLVAYPSMNIPSLGTTSLYQHTMPPMGMVTVPGHHPNLSICPHL